MIQRSGLSSSRFGGSQLGWRARLAPLALCAFVLVAGDVAAQSTPGELSSLAQRMERLERDLQAVQRQVYSGSGGQPSGLAPAGSADPAYAQLQLQVQALEGEMQNLLGQIEQTQIEMRQLRSELDARFRDIDFRLSGLEGREPTTPAPLGSGFSGGAAPGGTSPAPITSPGPGASAGAPDLQSQLNSLQGGGQPAVSAPAQPQSQQEIVAFAGPPEQRYDNALTFLQQGDHANAERALSQFITDHGDSELAGNAYYWLAETYYVRSQYRDAASTFLEGLQKHPDSTKAPDSLLKLGMSLSALGQNDQACRTFSEVSKRYPNSTPTVIQRARIERNKAGC